MIRYQLKRERVRYIEKLKGKKVEDDELYQQIEEIPVGIFDEN